MENELLNVIVILFGFIYLYSLFVFYNKIKSKNQLIDVITYILLSFVIQLAIMFIIFFLTSYQIHQILVLLFGSSLTIQIFVYLAKTLPIFCVLITNSKTISLLIWMVILFLLVPNVIFGLLYDFWLNIMPINPIRTIYFSFAINYSLPLVNDQFEDLLKSINENNYLRITQMLHILSSKVIELIILGLIVSKILFMIQGDKNKDNH